MSSSIPKSPPPIIPIPPPESEKTNITKRRGLFATIGAAFSAIGNISTVFKSKKEELFPTSLSLQKERFKNIDMNKIPVDKIKKMILALSEHNITITSYHAQDEVLLLMNRDIFSKSSLEDALHQFEVDFTRSNYEIKMSNGETVVFEFGTCSANPALNFDEVLSAAIQSAYPDISRNALDQKIQFIKICANQTFESIAVGSAPFAGNISEEIPYKTLAVGVHQMQLDTFIIPKRPDRTYVIDFSYNQESISAYLRWNYYDPYHENQTIMQVGSKLTLDIKNDRLELCPFHNPIFFDKVDPFFITDLAILLYKSKVSTDIKQLITLKELVYQNIEQIKNQIRTIPAQIAHEKALISMKEASPVGNTIAGQKFIHSCNERIKHLEENEKNLPNKLEYLLHRLCEVELKLSQIDIM